MINNSTWGIHLEKMKTLTQKDTCTLNVHSSAIYNMNRKQPKCPLIARWIKAQSDVYVYIYRETMEYSTSKRRLIIPFVATWVDLEIILLSKVNQEERQILCDIIYMWNLKK